MIGTLENASLLDHAEELASMVLHSEYYALYQESKNRLERDEKSQQLIKQFLMVRDKYDEVQRFGRYHPDYKSVIKEMMECKRELDVHPFIADYKKKENQLNELLGEVSTILARSVSSSIKVPTGDPFFDRSCGTGCGSGGKCGCRVR
ncbi:YlbF family regulator [Sporolactobacillus shoreicorticis]|uniref:YlbF family regulator n=1 Tax=Sporolactobacillus shoreicorticis TaxID=1923877 RepID=A0ABW5S573_9BACL|nr:YlbF family regulator [Sporolactobacillus shoreicorticis]MCO7126280.1 YlbF family regulator [Sporolactobacillus shoreicorticis]